MAGKRIFKVVKFTHSGDSSNLEEVVEMPEGGAAGLFSVFVRRISGTGTGYIENIYGCFDAAGEHGLLIGNAYSNWSDDLVIVRDGDSNRYPYLKFELDFDEDSDTTEVELYITAY